MKNHLTVNGERVLRLVFLLLIAGCVSVGNVVDVPIADTPSSIPVIKRIPLKAGIYIPDEDYSPIVTIRSGGVGAPISIPFGNILRAKSLDVFSKTFEEAIFTRSPTSASDVDVIIALSIADFSFDETDTTGWKFLTSTRVDAGIKVNVRVTNSSGKLIWEKAVQSPKILGKDIDVIDRGKYRGAAIGGTVSEAVVSALSSASKEMLYSSEIASFKPTNRKHDSATSLSTQPAPTAIDLVFWDSMKSSTNPVDFQAYLQKFPNGSFASLARTRLNSMGEVAPGRLTPLAIPAEGTVHFGNYHALVIGIDNYKNVTPLKTAVKDANTVADLLQKEYGFKVTRLLDATRNQVLDAFDELRRKLTERDNLLIYYAGHGFLDTDSDRGFWLPVDADANRRANWLSNSDIADVVRATRAKHVLVVADSCYAGTLTRSLTVQMTALDDFSRLAEKRARTALVSGGLEPVEDAGGGGHSVFAKAFLDSLMRNTGVVDMSQIFSSMRRQVVLSAQQTPQYGDIRQTGHEGGDFIFVRRK